MEGTKPSKDRVSDAPDNILIYLPASESQSSSIMFQQGARAGFFSFWQRADAGSADAQAVLALMYLIGWVDRRMDLNEAAFWSARSAQAGNPYGRWVNAWTHLEVTEFDRGVEQLILSAEQGFAPAIYTLGVFCYNGVIVEQSQSLGLGLIKTAAESGHYAALGLLATLYARGQAGVTNMLYGSVALLPRYKLRGFLYRFKREKFDVGRLIYARSIILENKIRREARGENIDPKFEKQLAKLIPTVREQRL